MDDSEAPAPGRGEARTSMSATLTTAAEAVSGGGDTGNGLSWSEVQDICGELEHMFHESALKDAQRLRAAVQKHKEITTAYQNKQSSEQKHLSHLLANLHDWEEKEAAARARNEEIQKRLQELDAIKRDMLVQLDRFRLDEQSSNESLNRLLDKYEEARQHLVQYTAAHQNDIPLAKHQMSLYASVTGIKWDFSGSEIAGHIHVPAKQRVVRFELDPATDHFQAANLLWDKIDEAFDDIDNDL